MSALPNWNPALHPHGVGGRWATVASGDVAAKKKAKKLLPTDEPKSQWNFTGSKETQYHHRHITEGQMQRGRDLSSSQDDLYALMREGMSFAEAKDHLEAGKPIPAPAPAGKVYAPGLTTEMGEYRLEKQRKMFQVDAADETIKRVFNSSAYKGRSAIVGRDASGKVVAAAIIEHDYGRYGPKSGHRDLDVHELFIARADGTDAIAPPQSGTRLMQEAAKIAQRDGARLNVRGAVSTSRTFYEKLGGDFEGYQGHSQSTIATWSNEARDALAAGDPIPAPHYLIEGPFDTVNNRVTWVEPPTPMKKKK